MRSYLDDYDAIRAKDIPHALDLLESGDGWRPIAGGTDLMVLFNAGKMPFRKLFDIGQIPDLCTIQTTGREIVIGAAVTYTQIRQNSILQAEFPLLCAAASWTGGIANQNRGTIGGNIVNASPAADSAPPLLVYNAGLTLLSVRGERRMPYNEFHTGYKQMQLRPDELLYEILLPRDSSKLQQYSRKVGTRKAQAISKVSIAAAAQIEEGIIQDVRIAVGSVAPIPLRCRMTEAVLTGQAITAELLAKARQTILAEISPVTDIRSTDEYRSLVTGNLLEEFLRRSKF
jgi:CO/xanthine dehydrogenase FAD-binding subunit